MNDYKQIEELLNTIKAAYLNGVNIDSEMVYGNLIKMGITIHNSSRIDDNFQKWVNNFQYMTNIRVFVSDESSYFCHFSNDNSIVPDISKIIKMYIAIDDNHIYEAANRIFGFMAQNNIKHSSKIASEVRFDDIVIRVMNKNDAQKIQEFITSDSYIMSGMMKSNPFAFKCGPIAYGWDANISYNMIVASYVADYINKMAKSNQLNDVSYKSFVEYLVMIYNKVFVERKNIKQYIADMKIKDEDIYCLADYEGVTKILISALSTDKHLSDFYQLYDTISSVRYLTTERKLQESLSKENRVLRDEKLIKLQSTWDELYEKMLKKYGSKETSLKILHFMKENNINYFTRQFEVRDFVVNNGIDATTLRKLIINSERIVKMREILFQAVNDTYQKDGTKKVLDALLDAVNNGNYLNFTDDFGSRHLLTTLFTPEEFYEIAFCELLAAQYDSKVIPYGDEDLFREYIRLYKFKQFEKTYKNK